MAVRFDQIELADSGNHLYPFIEADSGYFRIRTTHGEIKIGPGNSSFSHFYTDRGSYYFNTATVNFDGNIKGYGGDETISNFSSITLTGTDAVNLPSGGFIDWANGDARIVEGETNNYSLSFKTYDGSNVTTALRLDGDNTATFTGKVELGSGDVSIKKTSGAGSGNHAAIELYSSGTDDTGAAIAIQQQTSEGDTIIFADYEPYVEWGISAENNSNEIHFTAGSSTGNIGSKTFRNNSGTARTAYKKININLGTGMLDAGGDLRSPIYYDRTNTIFKIDAPGGSVLGQTTFRQGASDQNNTSDTGSIPSTTGAEMLRLVGGYTNGQYTHELAKIDRGGNLPLYLRESKSTANSFTNLVRFGNHSNSQKEFEVFGDAQAYSYYSTGTVTGTAFYDTDNSGRYVDPGSTGDSTFLRGYIRSTKYKRFANTFDSELPSAMPMIGGNDSSIGRGYGTVGFDTNGRLAIYERVYTIKISGSGWLNRHSNPIPIFPPSGNHFLVVEDFVIYIDYAIRTGISNSGIAGSGQQNAYSIGFYENAQGSGSTASPGSGQFFTLGVMPKNFVQNATTDQGYYRDVPVHQSKLLPNRGLFLRTGRDCTSLSNAPGGIHYVQIKYRIINTSSEMESDVDYDVNYAGTTTNRTTPLHDADGSFISY